ncbi:MAG: helix-turn-helix domain-containing protein [Faecalibacterium sp.]
MYRPYKKLRLRMIELDMNQSEAAQMAGIPASTLCGRMTGKTEFRQTEIQALAKVLEIPLDQIGEFFFAEPQARKGA